MPPPKVPFIQINKPELPEFNIGSAAIEHKEGPDMQDPRFSPTQESFFREDNIAQEETPAQQHSQADFSISSFLEKTVKK